MSYRGLKEELKAKERARNQLIGQLEKAIDFYYALLHRLADDVVWDDYHYKKSGGVVAFQAAIECEKDPERKRELNQHLLYWQANYNSIRDHVFLGKSLGKSKTPYQK